VNTKAKVIRQLREEGAAESEREQLLGGNQGKLWWDLVKDLQSLGSEVAPAAVDGDLKELLKAHQDAQEKAAEEMLGLTRALKEQTSAAGEIVRK